MHPFCTTLQPSKNKQTLANESANAPINKKEKHNISESEIMAREKANTEMDFQ